MWISSIKAAHRDSTKRQPACAFVRIFWEKERQWTMRSFQFRKYHFHFLTSQTLPQGNFAKGNWAYYKIWFWYVFHPHRGDDDQWWSCWSGLPWSSQGEVHTRCGWRRAGSGWTTEDACHKIVPIYDHTKVIKVNTVIMIVIIVMNVKVACIIRLDDRQIGQNHLNNQNKKKTKIVNISRLPLSWILTIV